MARGRKCGTLGAAGGVVAMGVGAGLLMQPLAAPAGYLLAGAQGTATALVASMVAAVIVVGFAAAANGPARD